MSQLTLPELRLIRRFLQAHVRPAEIACKMGLGVGTVIRVASDRRLRRRKLELLTPEELPEDDVPPEYVAANLRRCPGCGGLVFQWPCLACRLRAGECDADREGEAPAEPQRGDSRTSSIHACHEPLAATRLSPRRQAWAADTTTRKPRSGDTTIHRHPLPLQFRTFEPRTRP